MVGFSKNVKDNEQGKFTETSEGDVAVRVVVEDITLENPDISVDVNSDAISAFTPGTKTVTSSATLLAVGGSNLANRKQIIFQPSKSMFIGASGVTTATGIEVARDQIVTLTFADDTVEVYGIVSGASTTVKIWEALLS